MQNIRVALVLPRGASHVFPDAFEPYQQHIPVDEQSALIPAYYKRLTSEDVEVRRAGEGMDALGDGDKPTVP